LVKTAKWAARITPWLTIRTGVRAKQLSQNDAGTRSTKKDPLLHKRISIKLFLDLYDNGEALLLGKNRLEIPYLLMHGTADTLVSYKASKLFSRRNSLQNRKIITFRKWRKMRHDLLSDTGKEMVFRFIVFWLSHNVIRKWNYSEQS
jgi:alpha-beta hydrolase superfamily lysophospholipase